MSTALECFCLMLSVAIPMAEVLSHMIVVEGCGYPMSESVVLDGVNRCTLASLG